MVGGSNVSDHQFENRVQRRFPPSPIASAFGDLVSQSIKSATTVESKMPGARKISDLATPDWRVIYLKRFESTGRPSKRIGADHFPAVTLERFRALGVA